MYRKSWLVVMGASITLVAILVSGLYYLKVQAHNKAVRETVSSISTQYNQGFESLAIKATADLKNALDKAKTVEANTTDRVSNIETVTQLNADVINANEIISSDASVFELWGMASQLENSTHVTTTSHGEWFATTISTATNETLTKFKAEIDRIVEEQRKAAEEEARRKAAEEAAAAEAAAKRNRASNNNSTKSNSNTSSGQTAPQNSGSNSGGGGGGDLNSQARSILDSLGGGGVSIVWDDPALGNHLGGVWSDDTSKMLLNSRRLAGKPGLLSDVIKHEYGHILQNRTARNAGIGTHALWDRLNGVYGSNGHEKQADCIALALGASWVNYTSDCGGDTKRQWTRAIMDGYIP